ncbi:PLDc N-terminal domain-containing protein [Leucobacter sp. USCH14]|uniref:PLDc N-terminal domain-containing protein n=1 Tax=Leucobacter sp. USCH14 TaxID=3024838 RepID=UPI0030ADD794
MHDSAVTALAVLPGIFALAHAVLGLSAILSLAKIGPQLTWPKMIAWIFFIAVVPLIGAIVWFTAGRRRFARTSRLERAEVSEVSAARTQ